jgi:polysaccharide export outer membrane protein
MKSLVHARALGLLIATGALAFGWGCSSGASFPPVEAGTQGEYQLDSGDQIRIIVFGQEELSGRYTVDGAGMISMPLIPAVKARGSTTAQLEQVIGRELEKDIVIRPNVTVQIENFRPFFILGEVHNPGNYPYVHGMTVLTAVAIAGGFTPRAQKDYVSITRNVEGAAVEGRAERSTFVLPGDVIFVHERFF